MQRKLLPVFAIIFSFIVLMSFLNPHQQDARASFHTPEEILSFKNPHAMSTIGPGDYFLHSEHCQGCHGYDSAGVANIDEAGNSVNLFDHWKSTMMANAAIDPFWRAKVRHEILVNPAHAVELQDKCTDCHAPMGRYTAMFHGSPHFGLADLATDSLGLDGVSCAGCHTIDTTVGNTFSGIIPFDTTRNIYGPFEFPSTGPMQLYEGYTPNYSEHMNQARLCSSCHTLITQSVDLTGNFTGGSFTEQATYHEYLNSSFPSQSITCQTCHMPQLDFPVVIANGFLALQPRYPFNQHVFAGANSFMLTMLKNNKAALGIDTIANWQFDTTIAATNAMLRERAINFKLQLDSTANDTAYFNVRIENKAGHKFPSGYPSRRAVVQLIMTNSAGDTLFKSGTFTNDFHVTGETPAFETHHDVIAQQNVPQIYEMVMGDVNGNFTSTLERAAMLLKDNRIPPAGFTTSHPVYDTVKVSNDALNDADWNKANSVEGSGVDYVHYHVPFVPSALGMNIYARVFYQSVPPKWVQELFSYNSAEIDTFRNMFNAADQTPLLIASDSLVNVLLVVNQIQGGDNAIKVYPSITADGKVFVEAGKNKTIQQIEVFGSDGKKVIGKTYADNLCQLNLPSQPGVYFIKITCDAKVFYKKVVRQ